MPPRPQSRRLSAPVRGSPAPCSASSRSSSWAPPWTSCLRCAGAAAHSTRSESTGPGRKCPPPASLFLEEKDLQRKESVEWFNMVLGKPWKVYRPGIEGWIVGLLQPVVDNLQKPGYVNRVLISLFHLGEEPLSVRNVERRTSRRANDLQYQIGIRYAGVARMALALSLKFGAMPIVVPVWVRDFDIDGELWVKLRLILTEPWLGAVSWAFVSLLKIKFELSLFRLFNLMGMQLLMGPYSSCLELMPNFRISRLISLGWRIRRKNRVGTFNQFNLLNAT